MKTYSKKHASSARTFEDAPPPPPKQKHFPHRRQTTTPKTPASGTTGARLRQETLTQKVPGLRRNRPDEDLEDLEEYDIASLDSPPKKKRRSSVKRQREQQTITQMDSVKSFPRSRSRITDSEEDDIQAVDDSRNRRKKRKVAPSSDCKPPTRNSAKKPAETLPRYERHDAPKASRPNSRYSERTSDTPIPPPKTPRTHIKKEIPSSQSPADSPLSIRSRGYNRGVPLSPLKERSVNIPTASPWSRGRSIPWTEKMEALEGSNVRNDDAQSSAWAPPQKVTRNNSKQEVGDAYSRTLRSYAKSKDPAASVSEELPTSDFGSQSSSRQLRREVTIKSEIQDSVTGDNGSSESEKFQSIKRLESNSSTLSSLSTISTPITSGAQSCSIGNTAPISDQEIASRDIIPSTPTDQTRKTVSAQPLLQKQESSISDTFTKPSSVSCKSFRNEAEMQSFEDPESAYPDSKDISIPSTKAPSTSNQPAPTLPLQLLEV